jgi:ankyrin repeat protein
MARLLLDNNSNVNSSDMFGCTAMHYTLVSGNTSIFVLLLNYHMRLSLIDKTGNSYLHVFSFPLTLLDLACA